MAAVRKEQTMKAYIDNKSAKQNTITITAKGLTKEEKEEVIKLVRRMKRKRSHEQRPRLMYTYILI